MFFYIVPLHPPNLQIFFSPFVNHSSTQSTTHSKIYNKCVFHKKYIILESTFCERRKMFLCTSLANHQKHSIAAQGYNVLICFKYVMPQIAIQKFQFLFPRYTFYFYICVPTCFIYSRNYINLLCNENLILTVY